MKNTILINCSDCRYEIAVLENNRLAEFLTEDKERRSIVGNIYAGVVKNILPARFAFVDIGEEKNAFLFLDDKKEAIGTKLKKNQSVMVQAIKDPTGNKGAYVTTQINITGRFSVLVAGNSNEKFTAVSKKIIQADERSRLQAVADYAASRGYSVILRTNSGNVPAESIITEIDESIAKYEEIKSRFGYIKPPGKLYFEENPLVRDIRDLLNLDTEAVYINDAAMLDELRKHAVGFFSGAAELFKLYDDDNIDMFRRHGINEQLKKALQKKVWLKSGAFLVIERTEALNVIDVNTGKYEGARGSGETKLRVNMEAAVEIARQLRLRNLSGIITVDFIDMDRDTDKQRLLECLRAETSKDRIGVNVVGMTGLGLIEMTRKKGREPLSAILQEECSCCGGSGRMIRS